MALLDETFSAFAAEDFSPYAGKKASSNAFNLQRQKLRLRLCDLLDRATCAGLGALPPGVEIAATLDHPHIHNGREVAYQEVALVRLAGARTRFQALDADADAAYPELGHLRLGVRLDAVAVTFFVDLPAAARFDREVAQRHAEGYVGLEAEGRAFAPPAEAAALTIGAASLRLEQSLSSAEAIDLGAAISEALAGFLQATWPTIGPILAEADALVAAATPATPATPSDAEAAPGEPRQREDPGPAASGDGALAAERRPAKRQPPPAPPRPAKIAPPPRAERPPRQAPGDADPRPLPMGRGPQSRPAVAAPGSASPDPIDVAARRAMEILQQSGAPPRPPPRPPERPQGPMAGHDRPPTHADTRPAPGRQGPGRPHDGERTQAGHADGPGRGQGDRRPPGRPDHGPGGDRQPPRGDFGGSKRPYELGPAVTPVAPKGAIGPGSKVILRSGLLAGREAVVVAVQGKQARVQVGAMEVGVPVADLSAT